MVSGVRVLVSIINMEFQLEDVLKVASIQGGFRPTRLDFVRALASMLMATLGRYAAEQTGPTGALSQIGCVSAPRINCMVYVVYNQACRSCYVE